MMTTSGFLSPAREGKLPEARTPHNPLENMAIASTAKISQPPPNLPSAIVPRADRKIGAKSLKEKKKDRIGKELFKPGGDVVQPKKAASKEQKSRAKAIVANNGHVMKDGLEKMVLVTKPTKSPGTSRKAVRVRPPKLVQPVFVNEVYVCINTIL